MRKIAVSRSPGARGSLPSLMLAGVLVATQAGAGDPPRFATAEEAVTARAWDEAARIWRREAAEGRAEAYLGLGNLWDLGVLGRQDPAAARAAYRKAAEAGLPAAAFNMGAMNAAGSGGDKDIQAAARWYARAALAGHNRAAFALGRLFAAGEEDLPANSDIAAVWLTQAARSLPAAQTPLTRLAEARAGPLNAPVPLAFQSRQNRAQVAWSAGTGPDDASVRVEVLALDTERRPGAHAVHTDTQAGMAVLPLPPGAADVAWRVIMIDPSASAYAASAWHDTKMRPINPAPSGTVRFRTAAGNQRASKAARTTADAVRGAGFRVIMDPSSTAPAVSAVRYHFAGDADMARDIAQFMPAIGPADVAMDPTLDAQPGEVVVDLAFD